LKAQQYLDEKNGGKKGIIEKRERSKDIEIEMMERLLKLTN